MEQTYIEIAAKKNNWSVERVSFKNDDFYLMKYTKGDLYFYSTGLANFAINHQTTKLDSNKLLTNKILELHNIKHMPLEEIKSKDKDYLKELYIKFCGLSPENEIIVKPNVGSRARGVKHFKNYSLFEQYIIEGNEKKETLCISPFYKYKKEVRFIMYKHKLEFYYCKNWTGEDFLNKYFTSDDINQDSFYFQKMKEISVQISNNFKFTYFSVDFMYDITSHDFILLEINTNPDLFAFTSLNERNFNKAVLLYEKIFHHKENLLKIDYK